MPRQRIPLAVTIIGAGRVGSTLALLLHRKGHSVVSVISRTARSARSLARVVHCPVASVRLADVELITSLVVIATPEDAIGDVARELSKVWPGRFERLTVAHTAGALTSDALSPIASVGGRAFSLHPIQTFPSGSPLTRLVESMKGVWYGFEGPHAVRPFARSLVKDLNGHFLDVPKDRKNLYHIACVFASNYPMVLVAALETLSAGLGLKGIEPFRLLLHSSIRNSSELGAVRALTGPLVRASLGVLEGHKKELSARDPQLFKVYSALGMYGIGVLLAQNRITEVQARQMRSILKNP